MSTRSTRYPIQALVGFAKRRTKLRGGPRRDFAPVRYACVVVQEPRPGLGDALVAERDHEGGRARGARDDPGSKPDALLAVVLDGAEIVLECPGIPAWGNDDELDFGIEVLPDERVDGAHELTARLPV